ncbi:putative serine/threonine-protein kinase pats1 [Acropora cervicornis]|uniref:Serine/threonine-protein kinase pats1 n=1 Tax=Acropora cervicornis TaxID=6130 RepID=A0AAD9QDZ8_ACRCE|nr:putative serine/threonine-protein kinase pats1 [Acropora cervicornis]
MKEKRLKKGQISCHGTPDTQQSSWFEPIPSYVTARGPRAIAAYKRAKATGKTFDRRVKVLLIGQDRVGKTSVGRSLKGEPFRANETSTDGVKMHVPLKNPGVRPWKFCTMQGETTAYHHKCAEYIGRELLAEAKAEETRAYEEFVNTFPRPTKRPRSTDRLSLDSLELIVDLTEVPDIFGSPQNKSRMNEEWLSGTEQAGNSIPNEIVRLLDGKRKEEFAEIPNGIWPVIWDLAGQAVYRAIHPIFMSPQAVYVLVFDLTKNLCATAQCKVKCEGQEELEIPAPDSGDTNLDHIMRWLDLVHSLRNSECSEKLPPVLIVGSHSDCADSKRMDILKQFLSRNARVFSEHIVQTLTIDNTRAGQLSSEEDPQILKLREEILSVADTLPHTKIEVPLKWLEVENKVDEEDDFEHLLHFLHDRGTIVYHNRVYNPDGLVVLDPQWLIDVLCKIITAKQQEKESLHILSLRQDLQEKGILHSQLLDHACKNLELCDIKDSLLFIMKRFNLLCECKDERNNPIYLVPCMLTTKPVEDLMGPILEGHAPVYITFNTNYVPAGLFSRLLVLFGEWAASKTSCEQQQLFANGARFFVGNVTCLGFASSKSVIKVHIWTLDNSNPIESEPVVSSEVSRVLKKSLLILKEKCHWLRAVSWEICGQCKLCPGKIDRETGKCFRHQEQGCRHDDCAHYVPVNCSPFCCKDARGPDLRIGRTWIQAVCEYTSSQRRKDAPQMQLPPINGSPSEEVLEDLSHDIGEFWKSLGRKLKVPNSNIEAIQADNVQYPGVKEKSFQMLMDWLDRGESATFDKLSKALKALGKARLLEKYCSGL